MASFGVLGLNIGGVELTGANGGTLVGYGTTTAQDILNAVTLPDYPSLRAYSGLSKNVSITGYLVTSAPSGIAGNFTVDTTDTTSGAVFTGSIAPVTSPAAPVLSATAGGTIAATTYFVKITYVTAAGETLLSAEASLAVAVNNVLNVASPAAQTGVTGYNVYVSTATGTETKQNTSPIAIGTAWVEPTTGLIAGAAVPAANTSGSVLTVSAVTNGALAAYFSIGGLSVTKGTIISTFISGTGGAGTYLVNLSQTVASVGMTADNGGTFIIDALGRRWKRIYFGDVFVDWFGAVPGAIVDCGPAIQACINYVQTINGVVAFSSSGNYLTKQQLIVTGTFRSIKFKGAGTGDHQTASSGGTCLVASISGNTAVIRVEFNTFANENIMIDGVSFYNPTLNQTNGGYAIKIVRGANNSRYISGFQFTNIGIQGFAAAIGFQGMNTVNSNNNYIGNILMQNFSAQNCGIGLKISNAVLNLCTLSNLLLLNCSYGGIMCESDGEVGVGNGKGSVFIGTLCNKTHFEGVGGMFRTNPTAVLDAIGSVVRSSITLIDFTHESCGATVGPVAGEPYQLGANTDLHFLGNVVDGKPYGEVLLGYLNSSARIWCSSRMQVVCNGGRIMTPKGVNAPILTTSIANGANATLTVPLAEATPFAIKSHLILSGGQGGYIESKHWGASGAAKNTLSTGTPGVGITLTWSTTMDANAVSVNIANASGFTYSAELQIENLSSATINVASSV